MSWTEWSEFSTTNLANVPQRSGVYQLGIIGEITYIGQSGDLRTRLLQHKNTGDSCIKSANYFRFLETSSPNMEEEKLLTDYKKQKGRLPRCNEMSS